MFDRSQLIALLVLALNVGEIFGRFSIFDFIDNVDTKVVRVRTAEKRDRRASEFAVLDFIGLVQQHENYTAEEHSVKTPDGYILTVHRITGSPFSPAAPGKPVVFLQHGFMASSDFFVMFGPGKDFAFQLADAGYDVWLGNARGNTYSTQHVNYTTIEQNNQKYWDFSLEEMATIDLPKCIDAILKRTNQTKLSYLGVSMGTTLSYMLLSERPEYNDKINLVVSIAPVAFFTQLSKLLKDLINITIPMLKLRYGQNNQSYRIPRDNSLSDLGKNTCAEETTMESCRYFVSAVANRVNPRSFLTILSHMPAGTSLNTLDHFYQLITSGRFQKYKRGVRDPFAKFTGTTQAYNLSKITSPQALFYSNLDMVASPKGVNILENKMKNAKVTVHEIFNYNHMDFLLAEDGRESFYDEILTMIRKNTRESDDGTLYLSINKFIYFLLDKFLIFCNNYLPNYL